MEFFLLIQYIICKTANYKARLFKSAIGFVLIYRKKKKKKKAYEKAYESSYAVYSMLFANFAFLLIKVFLETSVYLSHKIFIT